MRPLALRIVVTLVVTLFLASLGSAGCGSGANQEIFGFIDGGDAVASGGPDATTGTGKGGLDATIVLNPDTGTAMCVKSSCTQLKANCGVVSDPKCGGVVNCGMTCPKGQICGGGGVPNQCGSGGGEGGSAFGDACTKKTCAQLGVNCGASGDGCGGMLSCGTCTNPQTCGGNPMKPGECGCTGTCAQVPTCTGGTTTTLSGKVYDPAVNFGLYNTLVYIPNDPTDPGLQPFPPGISCDVCGATAAGDPLVSTLTAPDGTFTLSGVPVGTSIPLVIQLGRWRRQFTVAVSTPCGANTVPDKELSMPTKHSQGDMPRIAMVTGSCDPVECVLTKIGIDPSEFTDPGAGGYINFFTGIGTGAGAKITSSTPSQNGLFATTGGPMNGPLINNYDMVVMQCECYEQAEPVAQETALAAYAGAGGRVFASDFQYTWFFESSPPSGWKAAFPGVANWNGNHSGGGYSVTATIDQPPTNPTGAAFQSWLEDVGVSTKGSGTVTIDPAFPNGPSVIAPTQEWLHTAQNGIGPVHFTFNTPIGAASANQCGRVTFSDWHAESAYSGDSTFPTECPGGALTPQEAILEFMIFDLSACVMPYTPVCTPKTCTGLGIECGPAGDGCGNLLQCGSCATGMTCGGGGSGKCGTTTTCTPETCAGQMIACGPAGDGCGHELQCGNCPTGEICGLVTPGQCGSTTSK